MTPNRTETAMPAVTCSAWLGAAVEVRAVLWNRLCGKAEKVTKHATLADAIAFVECVESGLTKEVINGELTFWDDDDMLASIGVRVAPNVGDERREGENRERSH